MGLHLEQEKTKRKYQRSLRTGNVPRSYCAPIHFPAFPRAASRRPAQVPLGSPEASRCLSEQNPAKTQEGYQKNKKNKVFGTYCTQEACPGPTRLP